MACNTDNNFSRLSNDELLKLFLRHKQDIALKSKELDCPQSYQQLCIGNTNAESNVSTDIISSIDQLPIHHLQQGDDTLMTLNGIDNLESLIRCVDQTTNKDSVKTHFVNRNMQESFSKDTFTNIKEIDKKAVSNCIISDDGNEEGKTYNIELNSILDNNFDISRCHEYKQYINPELITIDTERNNTEFEKVIFANVNEINSCRNQQNSSIKENYGVFGEPILVQSDDTLRSENMSELSNTDQKLSVSENFDTNIPRSLKASLNETSNLNIEKSSNHIQRKSIHFKRKSNVLAAKAFDLTTSDSSNSNQALAINKRKISRKYSFQNDNNYILPQSMMQQKINELISQSKQLEKRITVLTEENKNLKRKSNLNKEGELTELKKRNHELALNASNMQAKLKQLQQVQANETALSNKRKLSRTSNIVDDGEQVELLKAKYQQLLFQVNSYQNDKNDELVQDEKKLEESLKIANKERLQIEKDLAAQKQLSAELNKRLEENISYKNINSMMIKEIENLNKSLKSKEKIEMENIHLKVEIERNEKKLVSINDSLKEKELDNIKTLEEIGKLKIINEAKDKKLLHYISIEEQLTSKIENLNKEKVLLSEKVSSNELKNSQNSTLLKKEILKLKSEKKEKSTDCDSALIPLLCVHG